MIPVIFVLIIVVLGLVTGAFFYNYTIVKVRFHMAHPGLICWKFRNEGLIFAEATFGPDDNPSNLTLLWDRRTIECDTLSAASKRVVAELGELFELPTWMPYWLRSRLGSGDYLLRIKRADYYRVVDLIRKHERS